MNPKTIWTVAAAEIKLDRRLARTWFFIVILLAVAMFTILQNFASFQIFSAISSAALFYSPLNLLVSVVPTTVFFIYLGIIFLAFDILARDKRNRIEEVFSSLPVSNLELVFGRAIGITLLFYITLAIFIILYYFVGLTIEFFIPESGFAKPETYVTLATLVMDLFPTFIFVTSIVMFFTVIFRLRVIVALLGIGFVALLGWVQSVAPIYILNILNTISTGMVLPSEVDPIFTNLPIVLQRLATLTLSAGLLCWTATMLPRYDGSTAVTRVSLSSVVTAIGLFLFLGIYLVYQSEVDRRDQYLTVHSGVETTPQIDFDRMHGSVWIDPGDDLQLNLSISANALVDLEPRHDLVLSLNPGYEIKRLSIDGARADYDFNDGLLKIAIQDAIEVGEQFEVEITASGKLDPQFAYFDSSIDLLASEPFDIAGLIYLGSQPLANSSNYVALLPDSAWYPQSGPHMLRGMKDQRPRDFFHIDIDVHIPDEWHVAGPGTPHTGSDGQTNIVKFAPPKPLHEIAFFTSEFERRVKRIHDIDFELLVKPDKVRNIDLFEPVLPLLEERVSEFIGLAEESGLSYPFETFTIVEIPINLRSYRGGWRGDVGTSFPGIFALREGGFLNAHFDTRLNQLKDNKEFTEEEIQERSLEYVLGFFNNDISGGNLVTMALNNVLQYQTDATGEGAIPLSYIMDFVAKSLIAETESFYSVYILKDASSFGQAAFGMVSVASSGAQSDFSLSQYFYNLYINRPDVWDAILDQPFGVTDYSDISNAEGNLHVLHLRGRAMAHLLRDWLGRQNAQKFLSEVRRRFEGTTYTYDDLVDLSQELGNPIDEAFGNWMGSNELPGFRTGPVEIVRLPDYEYGQPRYEASFYVENSEDAAGLFAVEYGAEVEGEGQGLSDATAPIKLSGKSAVEVSIQSENPIASVNINPYFSHNRKEFTVSAVLRRNYPTVEREPKPFVRPVDWQYEEFDGVIVDDLDPGFSVDSPNRTPMPAFIRTMVGFAFPEPALDQGLPVIAGFTGNIWSRQANDESYGKYRRTIARIGDNSRYFAHFDAEVPDTGRWRLEYHLPGASSLQGAFSQFTPFAGAQIRTATGRRERRARHSDFRLLFNHNDESVPIDIDGSNLETGWNNIGVFDLEANKNARVSVIAVDSTDEAVVADAIRWSRLTLN